MERAGLTRRQTVAKILMNSNGAAGVGIMLLFAVTTTAFLLICEFYYAFMLKQNIEDELSRAVNIAVDLSVSDAHRQDRLSELDSAVAYDMFYEYLRVNMNLSPSLEARGRGDGVIYKLDIGSLSIRQSPPEMRVSAVVTFQPAFLGKLTPAPIRLTVRGSSVNRRIE